MPYVEGFLIPVATADRDKFIAFSEKMDAIFIEHGATRVWECWGDDIKHGKQTDFFRAVDAKEGETVCFSWVEWPDRETRERQMAEIARLFESDPRFDAKTNPPPFDGKRMVFGGFEAVVTLGE